MLLLSVLRYYLIVYLVTSYIIMEYVSRRGRVNAFVDGIQVEIIVGNKEERKDVTVTSYWRLDCTNTTLITSSIARNASKKFELISNLKSKVR